MVLGITQARRKKEKRSEPHKYMGDVAYAYVAATALM